MTSSLTRKNDGRDARPPGRTALPAIAKRTFELGSRVQPFNANQPEPKDRITVNYLRLRTLDLRFAVLFISVVGLVGCGGPKQPPNRTLAKGIVKLNGTPLKGGSVHLELAGDSVRQTDCIINEDGTFIVDNVPVGEVLIAVETESLKHGGPPESYVQIPRRYADVKTSGIKKTTQLGENEIVVDLENK